MSDSWSRRSGAGLRFQDFGAQQETIPFQYECSCCSGTTGILRRCCERYTFRKRIVNDLVHPSWIFTPSWQQNSILFICLGLDTDGVHIFSSSFLNRFMLFVRSCRLQRGSLTCLIWYVAYSSTFRFPQMLFYPIKFPNDVLHLHSEFVNEVPGHPVYIMIITHKHKHVYINICVRVHYVPGK